jgi:hypothetical protein
VWHVWRFRAVQTPLDARGASGRVDGPVSYPQVFKPGSQGGPQPVHAAAAQQVWGWTGPFTPCDSPHPLLIAPFATGLTPLQPIWIPRARSHPC